MAFVQFLPAIASALGSAFGFFGKKKEEGRQREDFTRQQREFDATRQHNMALITAMADAYGVKDKLLATPGLLDAIVARRMGARPGQPPRIPGLGTGFASGLLNATAFLPGLSKKPTTSSFGARSSDPCYDPLTGIYDPGRPGCPPAG